MKKIKAKAAKAANGKNEKARDWLLREFPSERPFLIHFSKTITFQEIADRMEAGEDFYSICGIYDTGDRQFCQDRMAELFGKPWDYWQELHFTNVRSAGTQPKQETR